jgi:hypothetical protein
MSSETSIADRRSRFLHLLATLGIIVDLCGCAGVAGAQPAVRQACAPDYHALCAGVRPGGGRIAACFEQNATRLSEQCRSALLAARAGSQTD